MDTKNEIETLSKTFNKLAAEVSQHRRWFPNAKQQQAAMQAECDKIANRIADLQEA
tara:strand:+ start:468 stop:635 length:168 start_codon:yes stop_codon:yes gene_type:complete